MGAEMLALGVQRVGAANRLRGLPEVAIALAGCGCGRLPGALSLPAAALAWYAFGPAVALGRFAVGALVAIAALHLRLALGSPRLSFRGADRVSPLEQLAELVPYVIGASCLTPLLAAVGPVVAHAPVLALVVGAVFGLLGRCSLGAVAVAAALRAPFPWLAAGILTTAGLAPIAPAAAHAGPGPTLNSRLGFALLAFASVSVATGMAPGILHPRLAAAAVAAVVAGFALGGPMARTGLFAPIVACAAVLLGSPAPHYGLDSTTYGSAFAGAPVVFTGTIERHVGSALLVRFAITCCRADAAPLALRLESDPGLPTGSWAEVRGVFRESARGLFVHESSLRPVARPADAYLYR